MFLIAIALTLAFVPIFAFWRGMVEIVIEGDRE